MNKKDTSERTKEVLSIISFIVVAVISAMILVYYLANGCSWEC